MGEAGLLHGGGVSGVGQGQGLGGRKWWAEEHRIARPAGSLPLLGAL